MQLAEEVQMHLKRKNQILFSKDAECLQELRLLLQQQSRKVLILWALSLAQESTATLTQRFPAERRPQEALEAAWGWACGRIRMPVARRRILDCHALAKELTHPADRALCHAIGQACSVVHTAGHAMGYPMYELSALVYRYPGDGWLLPVQQRMQHYVARLLYMQEHVHNVCIPWADFLQKESALP